MDTVATFEAADVQVTPAVRVCVLPSVYVPVATSCCEVPKAIEGLAGVTAIETRFGSPTFSVADPVRPLNVAAMLDFPSLSPVATPWLPMESLIAAMPTGDAVHATEFVMFCVEPPE